MLLPIRTDSPLHRTPYMNWAIVALSVAVFVVQCVFPDLLEGYELSARAPQLYQYFTYQFLHGDAQHIFFNLLFLYIFGNNVNDKMGHLAYGAFYLAGGVVAGIAFVLMSGTGVGGGGSVIGASGAVAAVTGAFLVLMPRSQVTVVVFFVLIGLYHISSMWFVLFFFLIDVSRQFNLAPRLFGDAGGTAHSAHIGGTLFGVTVCLLLLWARLLPRDLYDVLALIDRANRRRQHRDLVSRGYDPFRGTPQAATAARGRPRPVDPNLDRIQDLRAEISEAIAHGKLPEAARLYQQLQLLDASQVLSRGAQLDVANQLFAGDAYASAAAAWELFLKHYRKGERTEHVELMLAIAYSRYLGRHDRARELLRALDGRLTAPREIEIARDELAKAEAALAGR